MGYPDNNKLGFYLTPRHECSYLADHTARTVFADPQATPDIHTQAVLLAHGFRRSGRYLYRPSCPACNACIPARIPVNAFSANRSQRRCLRLNADLTVQTRPAGFDPAHFELYNRYQASRHPGGEMAASSERQYLEFLAGPWSDTRFCEFRLQEQLLAVAVVDNLGCALSAVYTFYEPALTQRSLGTYAVLWQVEEARRLQMKWVYLGYWIRESGKMRYKANFSPLEIFRGGRWLRVAEPARLLDTVPAI